jgi:hypothetical protein
MSRSSLTPVLALVISLALVTTACNSPLPLLSNPGEGGEGTGGEDTFEPLDLSEGAGEVDSSSADEAGDAEADGMQDFQCPDSPDAYALWFDHNVKFDTPAFGTWDIITNGTIILSVAEGLSEGTVHMPFQPGEVIVPGTVYASFGRGDQTCRFEGAMEVIVNIDGYCDRGVVHLNIVENWGDVDTTMTCCSGNQDCDTFPFQWMLPVVQYEDIQFTSANGYQATKPFGGGSGQLTWSLQTPIEPVPIVE